MSKFAQEEATMEDIMVNFQEALDTGKLDEARTQMLAMFNYSEEDARKMLKVYLAEKNRVNELIIDFTNGV